MVVVQAGSVLPAGQTVLVEVAVLLIELADTSAAVTV
jgi:hypothetical protein